MIASPSAISTQPVVHIVMAAVSPGSDGLFLRDGDIPPSDELVPVLVNLWTRRAEETHIFRPPGGLVGSVEVPGAVGEEVRTAPEPDLL
jgi:hypothetical protein